MASRSAAHSVGEYVTHFVLPYTVVVDFPVTSAGDAGHLRVLGGEVNAYWIKWLLPGTGEVPEASY